MLSFAQFEREQTGERIRDKFAASRAKGIWMGGWTPLGYDVRDRKLVINEAEARVVQRVFERFAQIRSVTLLAQELAKEGVRGKQGRGLDKGTIYKLLTNRVYAGLAVHKGKAYPGEHSPITRPELWDRVHAILATNSRKRSCATRAQTPAVLKALIFGPSGRAMSPTHTRKAGKLYRYYVSQDVLKGDPAACPIRRVAAAEVEAAVVDQIRGLVRTPEIVVQTWRALRQQGHKLPEAEVRAALHQFDALWGELFPAEQARIVQLLVERVDVGTDGLRIRLRVEGLQSLVQELRRPVGPEASAA